MADHPRIPRWLKLLWGVAAIGILITRAIDILNDPATSNLAAILLILIVVAATLGWSVVTASPRVRALIVIAAILLAGGFAALFRVENLTGGLTPAISYRWGDARPPDDWPAVEPGHVDVATTTAFDFPGFLGPGRDQRIDNVALETDWQAHPPQELWRQSMGAGWSGFAIVNGYAVTLEQRDDRELVTLYELETGKLRWAHEVEPVRFSSAVAGDGPRSTPAVDGGVVYAVSVHGKLMALDGASGEPVWIHDLRAEYGLSMDEETSLLPYGRPSSPLIVDEWVIVPVGGKPDGRRVSIAAFNKIDGGLVWEGGSHQLSMASPSRGTLAGIEQILVANEDYITGHALSDGRQLWEIEWPGKSGADPNVSQPVALPPDDFFISKGYGQGAGRYRLVPLADGTLEPQEVWYTARSMRTKFTNVAMRDGYVYGLSEGVLECIDVETGKRAWKAGRYGHGQILLVGEVLIVLSEDGEVFLVEATPDRKNHVFSSIEALTGKTWNHFALSGDRLAVRNAREAAVYRLALRN